MHACVSRKNSAFYSNVETDYPLLVAHMFVIDIQRKKWGNRKSYSSKNTWFSLHRKRRNHANIPHLNQNMIFLPRQRHMDLASTRACRQNVFSVFVFCFEHRTVKWDHVIHNAFRGLFWRLRVYWEFTLTPRADSGDLLSELTEVALVALEFGKKSDHPVEEPTMYDVKKTL